MESVRGADKGHIPGSAPSGVCDRIVLDAEYVGKCLRYTPGGHPTTKYHASQQKSVVENFLKKKIKKFFKKYLTNAKICCIMLSS